LVPFEVVIAYETSSLFHETVNSSQWTNAAQSGFVTHWS